MDKNIGLDRVLEPKGVLPPVAWKLDNRKGLNKGEVRIRLERVHVEWDSFQQILSSCGYKEDSVKARILDIVEKRGKLQNPFTRTGGVFIGQVEEIAADFHGQIDMRVGDRVYYVASLGSVPMYIESINKIDYKYGQFTCDGYAIGFETSPFFRTEVQLKPEFTLPAMDEAGSIYSTYQVARDNECKEIAIVGNSMHTMLMYAATMREAIGPEYHVIAIMDDNQNEELSYAEIREVLSPIIKDVYFVDFSDPVDGYLKMKSELPVGFKSDLTIVIDDLKGVETVAVLVTKNNGYLYFSSFGDSYSDAVLIAESIDKVVTAYAFDQYVEGFPEFTMQILLTIMPKLTEIDRLYRKHKGKIWISKSRAQSDEMATAGRDDGFIYQDIVTRSMVDDVLNIAGYDCNVIIQGETGVGKERVLSLIHQNSARHSKPCVKINCATIAESLAESEFFGYEAGSFTGAKSQGKEGYFEMANEGILFLDEIGTLSMNMQSKLLRVIQENQFYRVGGTKQISVNVRVICANNVPLRKLVDEEKFREDLYYRLNICTIDVPPLRERKADIIVMAEHFLKNYNKRYGVVKEFSKDALSMLHDYYWPGNVRELENVVHRLVISSRSTVISSENVEELLDESAYGDLLKSVKKSFDRNDQLDFRQIMEQQEKQIIQYALKKEKTTRRAAELLGLPQTTLARKKLKYDL